MKQEVIDGLFGAKLFYYSLNILVLIILLFYDSGLVTQIKEFSLLQPLLFLFLFCITTWLFHTTGDDPGIISFEVNKGTKIPIELSTHKSSASELNHDINYRHFMQLGLKIRPKIWKIFLDLGF